MIMSYYRNTNHILSCHVTNQLSPVCPSSPLVPGSPMSPFGPRAPGRPTLTSRKSDRRKKDTQFQRVYFQFHPASSLRAGLVATMEEQV